LRQLQISPLTQVVTGFQTSALIQNLLALSRQICAVPDLCCIATRRLVGSIGGVSYCQFSNKLVFSRSKTNCCYTLFAPSDLVRCTPGVDPSTEALGGNRRGSTIQLGPGHPSNVSTSNGSCMQHLACLLAEQRGAGVGKDS